MHEMHSEIHLNICTFGISYSVIFQGKQMIELSLSLNSATG